MSHRLDRYRLEKYLGRWIIVNSSNRLIAWSGSRWMLFSDLPGLCSFETPNGAHFYANSVGLIPAEAEASVA